MKLLYWSFEPPFISKVNVCEPIIALTIIYIITIFSISRLKKSKRAMQLKLFFGVYNQAQMPNKHILLHASFVEFLKLAEVGLTLFILIGLTPHFHLL